MADSRLDETFEVATRKGTAIAVFLIFAVMGLGGVWFAHITPNMLIAILDGLGFVAVAVWLTSSFFPLAGWRIDAAGIEYSPYGRRCRYLQWQEVESVKWSANNATFRGKGVRIPVQWPALPKAQQQAAREFVEAILSPYFDLSPKPDAPSWMVCVAGVLSALAITALLLGELILRSVFLKQMQPG